MESPVEALFRTLSYLFVLLAVAVLWEFVAWSMHKYIMHGPGWFLHADHHRPAGKGFRKNDVYVILFALVSFLCIYNGLLYGLPYLAAAGFGIALYSLCYVLFIEILFHRRVRWLKIPVKGAYMKMLAAANTLHHQVSTKEGARTFSFFWPVSVPMPVKGSRKGSMVAASGNAAHGSRPHTETKESKKGSHVPGSGRAIHKNRSGSQVKGTKKRR